MERLWELLNAASPTAVAHINNHGALSEGDVTDPPVVAPSLAWSLPSQPQSIGD